MSNGQQNLSAEKISLPTFASAIAAGFGCGGAYEFAMALNGPVHATVFGWIAMGIAFAGLGAILHFGQKAERDRNEAALAAIEKDR